MAKQNRGSAMMSFLKRVAWIVIPCLVLTACASQPLPEGAGLPGFFTGIWHGWCAPFALIGHILSRDIRVYAFPNNGGWYDFGFVLGLVSLAGGGAVK